MQLERDEFRSNREGGFPKGRESDSRCWLEWRPARMGRPYSLDLRERAVAAVEHEGMSCHQAADRFGVAPSTVITWVGRFRKEGHFQPGQMGGHKPRAISGEHHAWLVTRCKSRDFTLRGLVSELATERDLKVDYRSVWEFVHAEGLSFKKNSSARGARSPGRWKKACSMG